MNLESLIIFAGACLVLAMVPGPDVILLASRSLAEGRRAAFASLLGISCGMTIHAGIVAAGLSGALSITPALYDVIRYAGAGYLLYLAWQSFFVPPVKSVAGGLAPVAGFLALFRQGFLTNLLNPKVALFYLALFPQFVTPTGWPIYVQISILHSLFLIIGGGWNSLIIMMAGWVRGLFSTNAGPGRYGNWLLGVIFAGLALRLVFSPK